MAWAAFLFLSVARADFCPELMRVVSDRPPTFSALVFTPTSADLEKVSFALQDAIDAACMAKMGVTGKEKFHAASWHAAFVAGELFNNAAKWGNKFDPNARISVQVFLSDEGIVVSIKDQGHKPFDPFNDPGSKKLTETEEQFSARRAKLGKPLKVNETHGVFWYNVKRDNLGYAYGFSDGSQVIVRVPWTYGSP